MRDDYHMTILKIGGSIIYSFISALTVVKMDDNYQEVFTDIFFWTAAFLGTALMLLVEKVDPKTNKITIRRILFTIMASISIVFIAGTVRASMIEDEEFSRNHWFYGIIMFLCAIAPEMIRLIITDGGKAVANGFNKGIERRVNKMVGGDSVNEEYDSNIDSTNDE